MGAEKERRENFRRYADRRRALLLSVYEKLFDLEPGEQRDFDIIEELMLDFGTDGAVMASVDDRNDCSTSFTVRAAAGPWPKPAREATMNGRGLSAVLSLAKEAPGAMGLTMFRMPSAFEKSDWEAIWQEDFQVPITGLLCIMLNTRRVRPSMLWLVLTGPSREWSSHDRELLEEVASVLTRAEDKGR